MSHRRASDDDLGASAPTPAESGHRRASDDDLGASDPTHAGTSHRRASDDAPGASAPTPAGTSHRRASDDAPGASVPPPAKANGADRRAAAPPGLAATSIPGLDDVLRGGLVRDRVYVIEGVPGSGKTTLALQFLMEGVRQGEPVLYVALSETAEELRAAAATHGWTLEGIDVRELHPSDESLRSDDQYTMFHPSEVELGETTRAILEHVERTRPARVVFDSLSEFRLLAGNSLRYRRQVLALKQFFVGRNCTVLLLDDLTSSEHDTHVQSIAHGVLRFEQLNPEYGVERRRLHVIKYRGVGFRGGYHDYVIRAGGIHVFPRLVANEHRHGREVECFSSGVPGLDALLGGGIDTGTSTLLVGAAGAGKSTIAAMFATQAAAGGAHAAIYTFDESHDTLLRRCAGLGVGLAEQARAGRVEIHQVDPAELCPGEFAHRIRSAVDERGARVVVIDSLNGYLNAMPGERFLVIQLHELLMYLGQRGVATILVGAHHGLVGAQMAAPVDASYLADTIVLLRYFELRGVIRQAISVVKKRGGSHERTIRELTMEGGVAVGEPLSGFRGVLTGVPVLADAPGDPPGGSAR